ncbi:hypothetical protein MOE82_17710 [Bacillus licheniformis]|uniref:hypothetical protein n=1 Tax=Bacillus TaxID=1386 RepID=UPI00228039E8|nr:MULTISPECIES: hypothetical protein [Bacillus]MCY9352599.1 hypothetical protein [Bacillus licheniformis]MEC1550966.1 hypothetical protein [Bacillus haynesii]
MKTIDELANKYALHPNYVKSIIERMDGLAIKGNIVYAPKQSFLLPMLGVALLFAVIVILTMLAN